jgi:SAM-dependent methyltransferase
MGDRATGKAPDRRAENFVDRVSERWQPPAFRPRGTFGYEAIAVARRLVDLQAASLWRDLQDELRTVEGDVLDVGAGAQPYRSLLERPRVRYRAIDVAGARERFGYYTPDTDYFDGDTWPVEDASIDLVLATETLEHVPRPASFLAEARRVLRPGGRLVVTVPFSARWHYIPDDYWRFTPSSLCDLFSEAGFAEVVVRPRGNELTVACSKVVALILAWLLPSREPRSPALRALALLGSPLIGLLVPLAHVSLRAPGGDDCLGWTATATAA